MPQDSHGRPPDLSRVHLVGIGGVGMSAIATLLLERGAAVSGSDAAGSERVDELQKRGAQVAIGHEASNLDLLAGGPTVVVASTAIGADNVELVEAKRRCLPTVRRADALAALMSGYRDICVAGTHGKTSTTSMLTVALQAAGADPSFAIGGLPHGLEASAHIGAGDTFVAEADESDASFLAFSPFGAIITTIEPDHLDFHGSAEAYAAVFDEFVARIDPDGFLVAGVDDAGVRALLTRASTNVPALPRVLTYGSSPGCDVSVEAVTTDAGRSRARLRVGGDPIEVDLAVPGRHMVANAAAVVATAVGLGIDPARIAEGLASYTGVGRRFEFRGAVGTIRVYDDYAHHPTEIAATLAAARSVAEGGRVVAIFQPHLYSRTAAFATQFAEALSAADVAVVLDVYGAREAPLPGVSGELIAAEMQTADMQTAEMQTAEMQTAEMQTAEMQTAETRVDKASMAAERTAATEVHYVPTLSEIASAVTGLLRPRDVVITMGAGDITTAGPLLLSQMQAGTQSASSRHQAKE